MINLSQSISTGAHSICLVCVKMLQRAQQCLSARECFSIDQFEVYKAILCI